MPETIFIDEPPLSSGLSCYKKAQILEVLYIIYPFNMRLVKTLKMILFNNSSEIL